MRNTRQKDFAERRNDAVAAKAALLEKFKNRPGPEDPAVQARLAEREAILAARAERDKEREKKRQVKLAEEARLRAIREEEERIAAQQREEEEREREAQQLALEAAAKAKRDARYAARKQRGRKIG